VSLAGLCVDLYKLLFHFKVFLWESIILLLPSHPQSLHYCNTIARLLSNIRPPPPTYRVYAIHHTILAMTISCKGQVVCMCGTCCRVRVRVRVNPFHRRCLYTADTSTHAQRTDPRVSLLAATPLSGLTLHVLWSTSSC